MEVESVGWLPLAASLGMVLVLFGLLRRPTRSAARLSRILAEPGDGANRAIAVRRPFHERTLRPLFATAGSMILWASGEGGRRRLDRRLTTAGRPYDWTAVEFLGLRIVVTLLSAILVLLLFGAAGSPDVALLMAVMAALAGYLVPGMWLARRIDARQREMGRDLPDMLDMLSLCLDAGLSLESAIELSSERWRGALIDEFKQTLREVQLGQAKHDAFRRMARRSDLGELSALVAAMIQAEELGGSLKNTLKLQAIEARAAYRNRVRESAYRAPIRMIIPMTVFILPAMFIVIIGPAVPQVARSILGQQ